MYDLFIDSDEDISLSFAKENNLKLISMPYIVDGVTFKPYEDFETFDAKTFYNMLRGGTIPTTCGISSTDYCNYFEPSLKEGKDILYIHFSRKMSGTFMALDIAIDELKEKYPNRRIELIDTLGITICSYIQIRDIVELYKKNATIDEIIAFHNEEVQHYATYFFADDLKFFKRSGRVSNLAAFFGGMIGIRPLITMSKDGIMTNIGKVKGKTNAINALVKYVKDLSVDIENHLVIIGQCDAMELASLVRDSLQAEYNNKLSIEIVDVNPTAGAHCGPDTVGVAFYAKNR